MSDASGPEAPKVEIRPLSGRIDRRKFVCGLAEIDSWVGDAYKDHQRLKCRVWTAHLEGNPNPVGMYSLRIRVESDEDIAGPKNVFRVENKVFSAVQLVSLAAIRPMQGQGLIGPLLVMHALREFSEVATRTGICALTLVAADKKKAAFYKSLGFEPYGADCERPKMFYPARAAIELVAQ